jgi:hypothetical protein
MTTHRCMPPWPCARHAGKARRVGEKTEPVEEMTPAPPRRSRLLGEPWGCGASVEGSEGATHPQLPEAFATATGESPLGRGHDNGRAACPGKPGRSSRDAGPVHSEGRPIASTSPSGPITTNPHILLVRNSRSFPSQPKDDTALKHSRRQYALSLQPGRDKTTLPPHSIFPTHASEPVTQSRLATSMPMFHPSASFFTGGGRPSTFWTQEATSSPDSGRPQSENIFLTVSPLLCFTGAPR